MCSPGIGGGGGGGCIPHPALWPWDSAELGRKQHTALQVTRTPTRPRGAPPSGRMHRTPQRLQGRASSPPPPAGQAKAVARGTDARGTSAHATLQPSTRVTLSTWVGGGPATPRLAEAGQRHLETILGASGPRVAFAPPARTMVKAVPQGTGCETPRSPPPSAGHSKRGSNKPLGTPIPPEHPITHPVPSLSSGSPAPPSMPVGSEPAPGAHQPRVVAPGRWLPADASRVSWC